MVNISDNEKFQIGLTLEEEEEEKNYDENIEAAIPREHEPVKITAGDLGLQLKINIWSRSSFLERYSLQVKNLDLTAWEDTER